MGDNRTGECRICEMHADLDALPARERIYVDDHWRLSHGWSSLEGWLVACPRVHVESLDELDAPATLSLAPMLAAATAALRAVVGAERTYVMLFAETAGFRHVHLHIVPRMPWFTDADTGLNVFRFLDEDQQLSPVRRDELAEQLKPLVADRLRPRPG